MNEQQCKAKGGTWKDGKCINNPKPSFKSIKENYNPFKMWGAWVGFVIGIISVVIFIGPQAMFLERNNIIIWLLYLPIKLFNVIQVAYPFSHPIVLIFFQGVYGFLLGYGIHSLIRKYKHSK